MDPLQTWTQKAALIWTLSLLLVHVPYGFCEDFRYGFGIQPSFMTGDYGTGDDVDIFYLPLVFKIYPTDRFRGTLVVPWVYQSSTQVISAGGTYYGIKGTNNRANRKSFPPPTTIVQDAPEALDSESGLGDITLRGEVDLLLESLTSPSLIVEGQIKLPTASESKGLGTGELDSGIAFELGRTLEKLYLYGRLGYTMLGEPSGADFDDSILYEAGIGFEAGPELYLYLSLAGRTSIDDDVDDPLEALVSGSYRLQNDLYLNGYFLVGLSHGSPDVGLGGGFLRKF